MNIQKANGFYHINNINFKGEEKKYSPQQFSIDTPKVETNFDTAKAYAIYGITDAKKINTPKIKEIEFEFTKGNDKDKEISIYRDIYAKPVCLDIQQYIDYCDKKNYPKGFIKSRTLGSGNAQFNVIAVKFDDDDNKLKENVDIARKFLNPRIPTREEFESVKQNLKLSYKQYFDENNEENKCIRFKLEEDKNGKKNSLSEITKEIDNLSYEEYKEFCNYTANLNEDISLVISVPESYKKDKQKLENKIRQIYNNGSI